MGAKLTKVGVVMINLKRQLECTTQGALIKHYFLVCP